MIRQAVREAAILLIAAMGIALAVYAVRPDKIANQPIPAGGDVALQSTAMSGYAEIPMDVALRLYHENQAIFADARPAADYEAGHVKGALHLNPADQDAWLSDLIAATDSRATIVTYCDGEDCHLATELAELLYLNGFENVYYLKNGWTRWRENGLPVE
jgi:rhodanese-related sulfurtransferase